ncbi:FecR family protein [Mucilaginibacter sp. KACC 22063]|uniref:FecR family protein n=1 Tax=Mucilaginibacter sp. KACC 22063 TaxID=3025666 RepID=UPI002366C9B0|nr:FecR family protein [Mucilaginibacter sp. KACC 22063]WDF56713.1 DUF4974 domain-containing protein [Mucilaginibacter sp. KACC 22063]
MQPNDIEAIIERYNAGKATPEEVALVESWYLKYPLSQQPPKTDLLESDQQESLNLILNQINGKSSVKIWKQLSIAASILIVFAAGLIYILKKHSNQHVAKTIAQPKLMPGGNKAVLTLANGKSIILNSAQNGTLATQGNMAVKKVSDGTISYAANQAVPTSATEIYNTATTPRGGLFQFILADGTKVWLNSASSIRFPVAFNGNQRRIELTGEAYFEVTHDPKKPFIVECNGQEVQDLGTHFNINAYSDEEAINTTLLEGSVKITAANTSTIISPGQQAKFRNGKVEVTSVNTDDAVAWKNGLFNFNDNTIQEVMRQLARWYDVQVKYEGQLPPRHFSGEISRNVEASQILDILSFKKVHYRIEGKCIIITP